MNAKDQAQVRATIVRLLTGGDDEAFGIDVWAGKFIAAGAPFLPTSSVARFNPFDGMSWPDGIFLAQRVAAARCLRAALVAVELPERATGQTVLAVRGELPSIPEEYVKAVTRRALADVKLTRSDLWRRGFRTEGMAVWQEVFDVTPGRSKLDGHGIDQHGYKAGFTFDRWLIDVWKETGLAPIKFSGVSTLVASD